MRGQWIEQRIQGIANLRRLIKKFFPTHFYVRERKNYSRLVKRSKHRRSDSTQRFRASVQLSAQDKTRRLARTVVRIKGKSASWPVTKAHCVRPILAQCESWQDQHKHANSLQYPLVSAILQNRRHPVLSLDRILTLVTEQSDNLSDCDSLSESKQARQDKHIQVFSPTRTVNGRNLRLRLVIWLP